MCEHSELVAEMAIVEQLPAQDRLKHAHRRRLRQIQTWTSYDEMYRDAEVEDETSDLKTADDGRSAATPDTKAGKETGYYYYSTTEEDKSDRPSAVAESKPHYPDVVNSALSCLANGSYKESKNSKNRKRSGVKFVPGIVLLEAASRNDLQEVRQLLESGIDPNVCNADGLTALHQCCIDDYYEMVQLLLAHGAQINACDTELWTPLHAAATCGHANLIKLFADRGADLLALNADGNMPYDMCEDEMALDVLEAEMSNRGITQEDIDLARALPEKEMLNDMKKLSAIGSDLLETRDARGATPLHIASANGYTSVVDFLLDKKVIIDGQDNDLWTPLHGAAYWGHAMVIEALIAKGADIEAKNKDGETPIEICEDPDIKERLMDIKTELEQSKLLQPIWLQPNSRTSTRRTSSIRRSSIRDKSALSRREMVEEAKMRQTTNPLSPPIASPRKPKHKRPIPNNVKSINSESMENPSTSLPSILIENEDGETDRCQEEISMSPQITRVDDARMIVPLASAKSEIYDSSKKGPEYASNSYHSPSWNKREDTPAQNRSMSIASSPSPNKGILKSSVVPNIDSSGASVTNRRTTITSTPQLPPREPKSKSSISGISHSWATLKTLRHLGFKLTNHSNMGNKGMEVTQKDAGVKNGFEGSEKCLLPELKRVRKLHNDYKLSNKFGKVFNDKTSLLCASTSSLHPGLGLGTPSTPNLDRKLGLGRSMPSLTNHASVKDAPFDNVDSSIKDEQTAVKQPSNPSSYNALSLSVRTVGSKKDLKLNQELKESVVSEDSSNNEKQGRFLENGNYSEHKEKFQVNKECCVIV